VRQLVVLLGTCWLSALALAAVPHAVRGDDPLVRIKFENEGKQGRTVEGKIVVTAQDGGILLLGRDGRLWNLTAKQIQGREDTGRAFSPLSPDEIAAQLTEELLPRFTIVKTRHFVIASSTESEYARWCGEMFESLLKSFYDHWRSKKVELHEPEFPLVAVIFPNKTLFAEFAKKDGGEQAISSHGYYSVRTNRMVLYDLTAELPERPTRNPADIRTRLEASAYNVATVVHEATHQIAFNCGMHTRFADNPLWLTEGLAMFCETPDLKSRSGWRTIGALNKKRLSEFQNFVHQRRKPDSLTTLVSDGQRFAADPRQTGETYSEAWALTYFLIKTRPEQYTAFLKQTAKKQPLMWDTPESRLKEFQAAFGDDVGRLDRELLRFTQKLSPR